MSATIQKILSLDKKHKEKVTILTEKAKSSKKLVAELFGILKNGTDIERGTVAEVMKLVSKDKPEMIAPYIDIVIEYINYNAPRVKWDVQNH